MTTKLKSKRRQLRVAPEDDKVIESAAKANSQSVSEYLVESALVRAQMEMADRAEIALAPSAWDEFVAMIDQEPAVNEQLAETLQRAKSARA
ncbi:MAG: DUF1778 domain-containing protein [Thermoleophilaceae bacterium]|nr:DUF1778 domain-containing protein [Thermoleophilaceae bacterium]